MLEDGEMDGATLPVGASQQHDDATPRSGLQQRGTTERIMEELERDRSTTAGRHAVEERFNGRSSVGARRIDGDRSNAAWINALCLLQRQGHGGARQETTGKSASSAS